MQISNVSVIQTSLKFVIMKMGLKHNGLLTILFELGEGVVWSQGKAEQDQARHPIAE